MPFNLEVLGKIFTIHQIQFTIDMSNESQATAITTTISLTYIEFYSILDSIQGVK